jgi:cell wall-associated NlpC family hydrolase
MSSLARGSASLVGCGGALFMAFVLGISVYAGASEDDDKAAAGDAFTDQLNTKAVPTAHRKWVIKAGQQCKGVSAPLIAAQIEAESNWDDRPDLVSPAGAQGLSQFMPGTWQTWGVDADGDGRANPFTPADAIMTQARYDCWLLKKVKSYKVDGDQTRLMLAAYNSGPDRIREFGGIPPYPETQGYVKRIMSLIPKYSAAGEEPDMNGPLGQRIAAQAKKWLGTPYSWGGGSIAGPTTGVAQGAGTKGFDCSSLTQYAVYHASKGKITLPRVSQAQVNEGKAVARGDIRTGDLVGFSLNGGGWDHIAVYIGGGQIIHAPRTGDVVKISSLDEPYYASKPMKIRRIG